MRITLGLFCAEAGDTSANAAANRTGMIFEKYVFMIRPSRLLLHTSVLSTRLAKRQTTCRVNFVWRAAVLARGGQGDARGRSSRWQRERRFRRRGADGDGGGAGRAGGIEPRAHPRR